MGGRPHLHAPSPFPNPSPATPPASETPPAPATPPASATSPSPLPPARFCATAGNLQFCDRVDDEVVGSTPSGGGMGSRDWSLIPADLLDLIASKSTDVKDYVRFRAVCKPWRSATKPTNPKLSPSLPWLLLAYKPDDPLRRFYSLSRRKIYTFHLPETLDRHLWGTPHGCMLMADSSFSLSLLNPITRALIHLPPITSFPKAPYFQLVRIGNDLFVQYNQHRTLTTLMDIHNYLNCYVFTLVENECLVVVSADDSPQLLYCKVGGTGTGTGTAWTMLHSRSKNCVASVAYHNRRFYAVYNNGDVVFWDVGSTEMEGVFVQSPLRMVPSVYGNCYVKYGMVAFGGELMLVVSSYKTVSHSTRSDDEVVTVEFVVFKLRENGWLNVVDIGDASMFMVYERESMIMMGVGGDPAAGWRMNSIYLPDIWKADWLETFPLHQIHRASMQEKFLTFSIFQPRSLDVFPPMWIMPTLLF